MLNVKNEYASNENLNGQINLVLKQGELIPKDSDVVLSLAGKSKNYKLSEIVSDQVYLGDFYGCEKETGEGCMGKIAQAFPAVVGVDYIFLICFTLHDKCGT